MNIPTINTPLTNPYIIPPTSLNCFNIGRFATKSINDITILNAIFTAINNTIAVIVYTTFLAIFLASDGNISFCTWFVTMSGICEFSSIKFVVFCIIAFSIFSSIVVLFIIIPDIGLYIAIVTIIAIIPANNFVPNLSIIDVLMFNSVDSIKHLLNQYTLHLGK